MAKAFLKGRIMIRKIKNIILCLCIAITTNIFAQNKSGVIEYKGVINQKYVDSFLTDLKQKDIPMNIKQGVVDMYSNTTPDEYVLNFKNEESYYYYNPPLDIDEQPYNVGSKAGLNSFYTNNTTDSIIEISQYLGNIAHNPLDWEITNKTKIIGGYKCRQAVATEKLYSRQGHYNHIKVIAWFAPDIPASFGPKYYKGLPGLILEIDRDKFTLTATKLNLNPKNKDVQIKRLDKNDKIITQEEANSRVKELMEARKRNR